MSLYDFTVCEKCGDSISEEQACVTFCNVGKCLCVDCEKSADVSVEKVELSKPLLFYLDSLKIDPNESYENVIWDLIKANNSLQNVIEDLDCEKTELIIENNRLLGI